jgi:hypothetical protein
MITGVGDLRPFNVIRLPYTYQREPPTPKRFVFLCNEQNSALCLKTTSKVVLFLNDQTLMSGVVFYPKGELDIFELDTAVQPDNLHPIAHTDIQRSISMGSFELLGTMPSDFRDKLIAAVNASKTMKPERKRNILARI